MSFGQAILFCTALVGQSESTGQVLIDGQATRPSVWLDSPESQERSLWDAPAPKDRPLRHLVRQMTELPPAPSGLPLPSPAQFTRSYADNTRPFAVTYVFLPDSDVEDATSGMLMNELGFEWRLTRPLFSTPAAFTFRPVADILFLAGPGPQPVLPPQLYEIAFDFQFDIPFNETFGLSLGITPGFWTDFAVVDGDDIRLPARALFTYRCSDSLFVAAGIVYTDNIRRNLLPGIGLVWNPTEEWGFEVMFPRARVIYRVNEQWSTYLVLERGGTTYNINTNGVDEDMEYRDTRLMLGVEIGQLGFADLFAEVGAAFYRELRFDVQENKSVDQSFILRVGARF